MESGGEAVQAAGERDLKTIGEEGDEDVGLDALLVPVKDRTDREVAFQGFERFLHGDELYVVLPELGGIVVGQVGA